MNARLVLPLFALFLLPAAALAAFPFPNTDAGRRGAAYLDAFNTGREDAVRACIEANVSKAPPAHRSVEDRLAIYPELRDQHGTLTRLRVVESAADLLHPVARTGH